MAGKGTGHGGIRKLPSGRYQVRYRTPDGRRVTAPTTFVRKQAAQDWLDKQHGEQAEGVYRDPKAGLVPFGPFAARWLEQRDLKPRTREHYSAILARHVLPTFAETLLAMITPQEVRVWHGQLGKRTGPTMRAHAYSLLKAVLASAVEDDLIASNPCRIRGAGNAKRKSATEPATLAELDIITNAMPERLAAMVPLAAWCALRFGELAELRRADVDLARGQLRIRRAVSRVKGKRIVGDPKSEAGKRSVAIPPHVVPVLAAHLAEHVGPAPDALLFPAVHGGHLGTRTLYDSYHRARAKALRPDLRFHDLRHTGLTLAAAAGASLAELMARGGHSTPSAAMRYQHAAEDRDRAVADALSAFHSAQVVALRPRGTSAR